MGRRRDLAPNSRGESHNAAEAGGLSKALPEEARLPVLPMLSSDSEIGEEGAGGKDTPMSGASSPIHMSQTPVSTSSTAWAPLAALAMLAVTFKTLEVLQLLRWFCEKLRMAENCKAAMSTMLL